MATRYWGSRPVEPAPEAEAFAALVALGEAIREVTAGDSAAHDLLSRAAARALTAAERVHLARQKAGENSP